MKKALTMLALIAITILPTLSQEDWFPFKNSDGRVIYIGNMEKIPTNREENYAVSFTVKFADVNSPEMTQNFVAMCEDGNPVAIMMSAPKNPEVNQEAMPIETGQYVCSKVR